MRCSKKSSVIAAIGLILVLVPLTAVAAGHFRGDHAGFRANLARYVASVEGVSPGVLRKDLKAGKTLLQIADGRYASARDLTTALMARAQTRLDKTVAAGRITPLRAQTIYSRLDARVIHLVTTPHPVASLIRHSPVARAIVRLRRAILITFSAVCNSTPVAARSALRAGGQPLAVCRASNPGIRRTALVTDLVAAVKIKLDAAAAAHPVLARHETRILAHVTRRLSKWVTAQNRLAAGAISAVRNLRVARKPPEHPAFHALTRDLVTEPN